MLAICLHILQSQSHSIITRKLELCISVNHEQLKINLDHRPIQFGLLEGLYSFSMTAELFFK